MPGALTSAGGALRSGFAASSIGEPPFGVASAAPSSGWDISVMVSGGASSGVVRASSSGIMG